MTCVAYVNAVLACSSALICHGMVQRIGQGYPIEGRPVNGSMSTQSCVCAWRERQACRSASPPVAAELIMVIGGPQQLFEQGEKASACP